MSDQSTISERTGNNPAQGLSRRRQRRRGINPHRSLLSIGPISLTVLFLIRALLPSPDPPHTFTIDALDLGVYVPAGRWSVIEIDGTDLAAGQLELFCSIGDHQANGMQGVLEVR